MKSKEPNQKQPSATLRWPAGRLPRARPSRAEHRLQSILDAAAEFYGTWDVSSGEMNFISGSLAALGYSSDSQNRHHHLATAIHPDDLAAFDVKLKAHLTGRTSSLDHEFRLRARDSSYKWFRFIGKVVQRDRAGTPVQLTGLALDIHDRTQFQQKTVGKCNQLSAVFEAAEDSVFVVEPSEFRLTLFNKSFEDLIFKARGIQVSTGMRMKDINPDRAEQWGEFFRQVLKERTAGKDYLIPSLDMLFHLSAHCLQHDGKVHGICVFGHDITDRRNIEVALRRSEEKFAKAYREGPLAMTLVSLRDERYIDVNDAFVEMSGYSREEILGKTPTELGIWAEPEKRDELMKQVASGTDVRNLDVLYRQKSGEVREASGSAVLIDFDGEPCMLAVVMDVTDWKKATEALQESEERLRLAIEAGHRYAFEWNLATDIVERSGQSEAILRLVGTDSHHTKQELLEQMNSDDRQNYLRIVSSLSSDRPNYQAVFRLSLTDGGSVWLEESGRGIFGPEGKLRKVIGITADVTELRKSEHALRELSRRLITSQEEERRRIARELHDHIGQEAALLCVQAQRIESRIADEEHPARADVHDLYRRIKVLSTDISKLSHRLHSSELAFLGLTVAAERLCRDFAGQYGIDVDYQPKSMPQSLDSAKSLCMYRVLQESLQNVGKHSRASLVVVKLQVSGTELVLEVTDNGVGFDIGSAGFQSGLGLLSMQERLNLVGGRFTINSKVGAGTKVTAVASLQPV
jgi:PAS domain S-box-containing protein